MHTSNAKIFVKVGSKRMKLHDGTINKGVAVLISDEVYFSVKQISRNKVTPR